MLREPLRSLAHLWGGLLLLCCLSWAAHCQTLCNHRPDSLTYWDTTRLLPARIEKLDGDRLLLKTQDRTQVRTITLQLESTTKFFTESFGSFDETSKEECLAHAGVFLFIYCAEHKTVKEVHRRID